MKSPRSYIQKKVAWKKAHPEHTCRKKLYIQSKMKKKNMLKEPLRLTMIE